MDFLATSAAIKTGAEQDPLASPEGHTVDRARPLNFLKAEGSVQVDRGPVVSVGEVPRLVCSLTDPVEADNREPAAKAHTPELRLHRHAAQVVSSRSRDGRVFVEPHSLGERRNRVTDRGDEEELIVEVLTLADQLRPPLTSSRNHCEFDRC